MRYHYTSAYYNNQNNKLSQGVKLLLIINVVVFILFNNNQLIENLFSLSPNGVCKNLYLWQCVTYAFLHGSVLHLLFNMLGLWFLGSELESRWGTKKFIEYYLIVAFGAGLITSIYMLLILQSNNATIGASGAVYGLLIPYTILFPNRLIYIYGIFPIKVKTAAIIFGLISFFYTAIPSASTSNTSHICHLAGMLVGILYLFFQYKLKQRVKEPTLYQKNNNKNAGYKMKKNVNDILDKINNLGWDALSDADKEYLKEESKNYNDLNKPN